MMNLRNIAITLSISCIISSLVEKSWQLFLIGVICLAICWICSLVDNMHEKEVIKSRLQDIPTPRKRFTYKKKNRVEIDEDDLGELLIYMAELEDYLQEKGKL